MVKIGDTWDRTTEFVGDNLRLLLPIAILAILIPTAISNSIAPFKLIAPRGTRIGIELLGLAFGILALWAQLAIASLAIDRVGARRATERLLPAIGVFLLLGIGFALLVTAIMVPALLVSGVDLDQLRAGRGLQAVSAGARLGLALLLLLAVIAVIAVFARLMPLTGVIVAERRGIGAIARAFRLTRGLTWRLFGVVLLYVIVSLVAQWAAQAVFGSVLTLIAGGDGPVTLAVVLTSVIVAAVQAVFTVLAAAFGAKLYLACVAAEGSPADAVPLAKPS